jgi:hypothetical protein
VVWYGRDGRGGKWGCPIRQRWSLGPHAQMSPSLRDRLAFLVSETGSYESAAVVAQKFDLPADDSTLHQLTERLGAGRSASHSTGRLSGPLPRPAVGCSAHRAPRRSGGMA